MMHAWLTWLENSQWVPSGPELKCSHGMLHTLLLVWVSYSRKDDGHKAYKTKCSNAHRLVHSKHFFVLLSVHAIGKTSTVNVWCTFTNEDDKDDKDKHVSIGLK